MQAGREMPHRARDQRRIVSRQEQRFGSGDRYRVRVRFFIEWFLGRSAAAVHAIRTRVTDDAKEPRAAVAADEGAEVLERPEESVLHDVFCIGVVTDQPSRQSMAGVEMWQNEPVEVLADAIGCHALECAREANGRPPTTLVQRSYE